jgi:hypothetical protein
MQIGGVSGVPNIYSLDYSQKVQPEERAEMRDGTTEEATEAKTAINPIKIAEQGMGLGRNIDFKV